MKFSGSVDRRTRNRLHSGDDPNDHLDPGMFWRIPSQCETEEDWAARQRSALSLCFSTFSCFHLSLFFNPDKSVLTGDLIDAFRLGAHRDKLRSYLVYSCFLWGKWCQVLSADQMVNFPHLYYLKLHIMMKRWEEIEPRMEQTSCAPYACQHWLRLLTSGNNRALRGLQCFVSQSQQHISEVT